MAKKTSKKSTAKKAAKPSVASPSKDEPTEPKAPAPVKPAESKPEKKEPKVDQNKLDWEAMANVFDSAVQALGDPTPEWTELMHKHVATNTRYAEKCRAQLK